MVAVIARRGEGKRTFEKDQVVYNMKTKQGGYVVVEAPSETEYITVNYSGRVDKNVQKKDLTKLDGASWAAMQATLTQAVTDIKQLQAAMGQMKNCLLPK